MKRILCPTDFSSTAENAVSYAAKLAQKTGASIHLFHVNLLSDMSIAEAAFGGEDYGEQINALLEDECLEIGRVFKVSCYAEPQVSGVSLPNLIAGLAPDYDLIVMGTNGEDGLSQKLFGSNTFRVIKNADIPVLMIPEHCGYSEIQTIAYTFDSIRIHDIPMRGVVNLARQTGSLLTVIQVADAYSRKAEEDLNVARATLMQTYPEAKISFTTLYNDSVTNAIDAYMTSNKADVLALCYRNEPLVSRNSGIVRHLTGETNYPLLVVH